MSDMSTFEPSKLGTKEHWDNVYEDELENFEEIGDEGEIWFGAESLEKMVDWALQNVPPSTNASILEVGSGNGTLLFGLLEAGYNASSLHGIDYSAGAVKLSKEIAVTRNGADIKFTQCDFLTEGPQPPTNVSENHLSLWNLILDKGTYDAIALGEPDAEGRLPTWSYPGRVALLLKTGGHFLITSCNFTEDELKASFITDDTGLVYHSRIQHPVFSFGGVTGSSCSSVAFVKK